MTVSGVVQGVGFRPFVYEWARRLELVGFVRNHRDGVRVEVQGKVHHIRKLLEELSDRPPPLSRIERLEWVFRPFRSAQDRETGFRIEPSTGSEHRKNFVTPDAATCPECVVELFEPTNRRFRYPFISCVNCGPRMTIVEEMPLDRERTTMKSFPLCSDCRSEYERPTDRRFHAQTIACVECGPSLRLHDPKSQADLHADPIAASIAVLMRGGIVALKGVGGYHLACDATNPDSVRELRSRKHRDEKPLAIMVADLKRVQELCEISEAERLHLVSSKAPIVLLKRRQGRRVAEEVSLTSPFLGVMLPYAPLHHLLLQGMKGVPLVMTSANESDRPIAHDEDGSIAILEKMADLVIAHDRRIQLRCDDSVLRVVDAEKDSLSILIRRGRGFAPEPMRLRYSLERPILAVGAQLKNTFALASEGHVILSHPIGDLDDLETFDAFQKEIVQYESLFGILPEAIAHDLHPDYLSTQYGIERSERQKIRRVAVQHHHAHLASCMLDNGLDERVIGVIWDGTGFGTDGKIWGGEFLVGDSASFQRAAHLSYVSMPGGDQAIREPWRMAAAYLLRAGENLEHEMPWIPPSSLRIVRQMLDRQVNCPMTSSMGRLFDAVAAIIGLRTQVSFEGQAAMELETLAMGARKPEAVYPLDLLQGEGGAPLRIDAIPLIRAIVSDVRCGVSGSEIAGRFHRSLIGMTTRVCERLRNQYGLNRVVLSGGVFMNGILLSGVFHALKQEGFQPFCHQSVPPNDGGISLGQVAVAAAQLKQENENVSGDSRKARGDLS